MIKDADKFKELGICKYCKKPLQYTKCPKDLGRVSPSEVITDILGLLGVLLVIVASIFSSSSQKKEPRSTKIITCTNLDCIDFLNGCFGKKGLYT